VDGFPYKRSARQWRPALNTGGRDGHIDGGKLGGVTKRSAATEQEIETSPAEESDDSMIARVSAARRSGDKAERGVRSLLGRASEKNKAALERLAK